MKTFTLVQWLAAFSAYFPRARGISRKKLIEQNGDDIPPWFRSDGDDKWTYGEGSASDAWKVLHAIASAARLSDDWTKHASWVRAFDHRDSDAYGTLPMMMGLTWDDLLRDDWRAGPDGAGDLVRRCNQLAAAREIDQRFFSLRTGGDNYVIVMLSLPIAEKMLQDELLELDFDSLPSAPRSPSVAPPPPVIASPIAPSPMIAPPSPRRAAPLPAPLSQPKNGQIRENADLLIVLGIALLAIPGYFVFHDMAFVVVPIFVAVIMLRDPLAKRVSWLRWMKR